MKIKHCGWKTPRKYLGRRAYGRSCGNFKYSYWRRGKPRLHGESTSGVFDYMDSVADAASFEAFRRHEVDPLLSAEALSENSSFLNFAAFAKDFPEKFFMLVSHLRPEFQELCIEYYVLRRSQAFLGKAHGFIQTRTWQNLRILEQAIGSLILLGVNPTEHILRPILTQAGLETTIFGSLADMIALYAASRDYACVAKAVNAPIPAVRKVFRPVINQLLADKDVKAVAVGAYLRSLTHQASLSHAGLSKSSRARLRRVRTLRFAAPASDNSPLISFGHTESLGTRPWLMLEISSDSRMAQIYPLLQTQGKRLFKKKPAQIFAPLNENGELTFGYLFARSVSVALIRSLTRIRGISELSARYDDEGNFKNAVEVPDSEVQSLIRQAPRPPIKKISKGAFVQIKSGDASGYCGSVIRAKGSSLLVEVKFPTNRHFLVSAAISSVKLLPNVPVSQRTFWGVRA